MMISVLAFNNRYVQGWPKHAIDQKMIDNSFFLPASRVLSERTETDAHFVAYASDVHLRNTIDLWKPEHANVLPFANLRMVLAVFDIDHPDHNLPGFVAPDSWWFEERNKIAALVAAHPGAFCYRTTGGYRILYRLAAPFPLRSQSDDHAWTSLYLSWVRFLSRRFAIVSDAACADWTRFFRAPFATRDGIPQTPETIGNPHELGVWAPKLREVDRVAPKATMETYGAVEAVPIADLNSVYGQARIDDAVRYLLRAALSIKGQQGRNVMFGVCCALVRRMRLPLDVAADLIEQVYCPRLIAAGSEAWSRDTPGPHGMTIMERLEKARDTGTTPPGNILDEAAWAELSGLP
jgi:hypothetical protein